MQIFKTHLKTSLEDLPRKILGKGAFWKKWKDF